MDAGWGSTLQQALIAAERTGDLAGVEDVMAAGKSPAQLAKEVEQTLARVIRDPAVTVIVGGFQGVYGDQIRIVGEPGSAPPTVRNTYANYFWYQILASDGSLAPDGSLRWDWARDVLSSLARLWRRPVRLETLRGGKPVRLGHDGETVSEDSLVAPAKAS